MGIRASLGATSFLFFIACSNDASRFDGGNGDATVNPVDGGGSDAVLGATDSGDPGGGCSADLRSVIGADGGVIETCDPSSACSRGKCIPACEAAAVSKGNVGCTFLASTPSFITNRKPPCYAVFVANAWPKDAAIKVERDGTTLDVTQFGRIASATGTAATWSKVPSTGIPPGEVGVLFLSHDTSGCPVTPAVTSSTAVYTGAALATGRGRAFRITSDVPVSAYDILPYGGASSFLPSAQLLFPTNAWGNNFVAALPPSSNRGKREFEAHWAQVIANEDNTEVSIVPNVVLPSGTGVAQAPANVTTTYTLSAGEFIQWQNPGDMSGSVLSSNKPIAFMGGQTYLCWDTATTKGGGCDATHQLVQPVSALGSAYVGVPYRTRLKDNSNESVSYRVVGAVDGTTLTFDPSILGAPASLPLGTVVTFEATTAFSVRSQDASHPFFIAQIMAGYGPSIVAGDEEFTQLMPPEQFLPRYVFFTDPTYTETYLTVVRAKGKAGFQNVNVACSGNVSGFTSIGTGGDFEYAYVSLVKDGTGVGGCKNGPQSASSAGSFGITVWGLGPAASYAYPAGGNVATINQVVVPAVPR